VEYFDKYKKEISQIGKRVYNKGLSVSTSGNISIRHENTVFITPSGFNLGDVEPFDVVMIDLDGKSLEEAKIPSSERAMHIEIYKRRPDISSIIHAHAPKSSAFAVAGMPLDKHILSEVVFTLGIVPVAEYARPSSDELATKTAEYFLNHDAVLMANHGVVVAGKELKETYYKLETLEMAAEIALGAKVLGNINEISDEEVQKLIEMRQG
jgi:L-fuculose-phosphate aldolase